MCSLQSPLLVDPVSEGRVSIAMIARHVDVAIRSVEVHQFSIALLPPFFVAHNPRELDLVQNLDPFDGEFRTDNRCLVLPIHLILVFNPCFQLVVGFLSYALGAIIFNDENEVTIEATVEVAFFSERHRIQC